MSGEVAGLVQPTSLGALLERSGTTTYVLGILYLLCLLFAIRRFCAFSSLDAARGESGEQAGTWTSACRRLAWTWDIPRLFLASIVFGGLVRTMSFITLAILALENVRITSGSDGGGGGGEATATDQGFYQRVLTVLVRHVAEGGGGGGLESMGSPLPPPRCHPQFNTGDWAAISTYLLLVVTWVEVLQRARKHMYNQARIRRDWWVQLHISHIASASTTPISRVGAVCRMITFIVVNSCLYVAQIGLYTAVFLRKTDQDAILSAIYAVIAFLNFGIPLVLAAAWCAYSVMFAGEHSPRVLGRTQLIAAAPPPSILLQGFRTGHPRLAPA